MAEPSTQSLDCQELEELEREVLQRVVSPWGVWRSRTNLCLSCVLCVHVGACRREGAFFFLRGDETLLLPALPDLDAVVGLAGILQAG